MEKITFRSPEEGDELSFFLLEKAEVSGKEYLLVTEEEEGDGEAYVLRKVAETEAEEADYRFVEEEEELAAVAPLFSAMLEDTELQF